MAPIHLLTPHRSKVCVHNRWLQNVFLISRKTNESCDYLCHRHCIAFHIFSAAINFRENIYIHPSPRKSSGLAD